ncbi:transferrin-binding protein-like solute binding protein [Paracoccus methylarcula]|uniref:Transferrin-binding protein B C-lobe/N-lobe beta-barrel domain-containing protein n=1 Tax=Paracoccus methylarcula TaxID=72022 RepID=A0A422R0S7_9RHOB|nr:transferrin-binding protein-like solute binding protein [Paracoccus methylarcula]RNF35743.1 hypothetical protein A7A09_004995 [Paracoccus methylarcula]
MNKQKMILSAVAVLSVAACGSDGSSGGGSGGNTGGNTAPSYNQLRAEAGEFLWDHGLVDGLNPDFTPAHRMPTRGTAHYSGVGSVKLGDGTASGGDQVLGRARMTANFDDSSVTGTVRNFKAAPGHSTTGGSLDLNGTIDRNTVLGNVNGKVNIDSRNYNINAPMAGRFLDDDADAFAGVAEGVTGKNGTPFLVGIGVEDD